MSIAAERSDVVENLRIEYIALKDLKPYEKNARKHDKEDVATIEASIRDYGMCDPIGIWSDKNIIVEGHGRLQALKNMGYTEAPCIRLDHLTDEQRRGYAIAHNKTAENSEWDYELLDEEMAALPDFDFEDFGFEFDYETETEEPEELEEKRNERARTIEAYNLEDFDPLSVDGYYQMPIIEPEEHIPASLIGFNYALTSSDKESGIHFYIDDYQFERIWNQPQVYMEKIAEYDCMLTPDFSLYTEMPIAMKIWNTYRSRLIGQIAQRAGIIVVPTVSWCEKETFDFCFDGLPKNATLSISTIGVKKEDYNFGLWKDGVDEMIKRLQPKTLLVYGGAVEYDYGSVEVVYYENGVTERMRSGR